MSGIFEDNVRYSNALVKKATFSISYVTFIQYDT